MIHIIDGLCLSAENKARSGCRRSSTCAAATATSWGSCRTSSETTPASFTTWCAHLPHQKLRGGGEQYMYGSPWGTDIYIRLPAHNQVCPFSSPEAPFFLIEKSIFLIRSPILLIRSPVLRMKRVPIDPRRCVREALRGLFPSDEGTI